jgi:hypothetical protein
VQQAADELAQPHDLVISCADDAACCSPTCHDFLVHVEAGCRVQQVADNLKQYRLSPLKCLSPFADQRCFLPPVAVLHHCFTFRFVWRPAAVCSRWLTS